MEFKLAESLGMTVSTMKLTMTKAEFNRWILYHKQKPAEITEVQLAIIATLVSNAAGGKAKVKDFLLSGRDSKSEKIENGITPDEVANVFRGIV